MRYLLVTHIPFARQAEYAVLDKLWAEDLKGLAAAIGSMSVGPITVAAPELDGVQDIQSWSPTTSALTRADGFEFLGLPAYRGRADITFNRRVRAVLKPAVLAADLVHSSNLFPPYTAFWFGHDFAVAHGKKTLFVVAEDFYDTLNWEWVRPRQSALRKMRRRRALNQLDAQVRKRVANASLTFLHTPASVARYREFAANAVAIRQPVHEAEDVVGTEIFEDRIATLRSGEPLRLISASRIEPLKGVDFLLRAVAILKQRQIPVTATIYGKGGQWEELKQLAQKLKIADQVSLPGPLAPGYELRTALNKAHLFLMPHLTTDFGRAFFDAMAAGLPVIAFRSPASQDTVHDRVDGLLTPNVDAEGLADGIGQFHEDREFLVRASQAARNRGLRNTRTIWNDLRAQMIAELF